jgi:hypothetical protein
MWDHRGNYSDIVGFEIDGSGSSTTRNGIYVGGSYNSVQGNHVHNIAQSICDSTGGSAIGSDSYYYGVKNDVTGNIVDHVGSSGCSYVHGIYISTSGNVKNNLVYNVGGAAIHLWHDASNVNIVNNTTTSSGVGIVVGGGDFYHSTTGKADYVNVFNNIVFDNGIGVTEQGTTGANNSYLNNLVYQNSSKNWDLDPGKSNANTISADPQFVNYNRTGTSVDFHLKSTSPAINKGTANLAPSTDIEGTARPQNSYFDIGAYEYKAGAAVMSVSPTSLAFGSQQVGTTSSPPKIITIKNVGTGNMSFPSAFVMSGDYAFGGTGTCTVGTSYAPGASCTASVVFKPTATGTRTGSLKITSNVSSVTVPFSGTGF